MTEQSTHQYLAAQEIEIEFPDTKHGNRYVTIPAGQALAGEARDGFLYIEIQGHGPARIPLALLDEVNEVY